MSGVLVALLAAAFAAGNRGAAAVERRALEHSERRFRALVHNASEVVVVIDAEHRITHITDAVLSMFGHDPATFL